MSDDALVIEFLEESLDSLTELDEKIAALLNSKDIVTDVNEVFRPVHSIKGASSFFKLTNLMQLAHKLETLLDQLRQFKRKMTEPISEVLNRGFFLLRGMVERGLSGDFEATDKEQEFIQELEALLSQDDSKESIASQLIEQIHSNDPEQLKKAEEQIKSILGLSESSSDQQTKPDSIEKIEDLLHLQIESPDSKTIQQIKDKSSELQQELEKVNADEALKHFKDFMEDFSTLADSPVGIDELLGSMLFEKLESVVSTLPTEKEQQEKEEENSKDSPIEQNQKEKESEESKPAPQPKAKTESKSIRINVQLLEDIMNLMSELVLSRNQLNVHSDSINNPELTKTTQQVSNIMTELQGKVMKTRLQPVSTIFNPLPGVVREISRNLEKEVELELHGKETELDRSILESIKDPLTHIIRNSLDHGIEKPEDRSQKGKDPKGILRIGAYHEGGQVVIEIKDDGNGVNIEKVAQKAIEKGLFTQSQIDSMTEKQVAELIFNAGFSTADKISQVSGRGVGMDVVKSNIVNLGGHIDMDTVPGKGTTLKLKIPLTLAIIPALIVETHGQRYAISQANLEEMVLLKEEDQAQIQTVRGTEVFRLRGEVLPLLRLNRILDLPDEASKEVLNIIILTTGKKSFGLIVDVLHDIQEIVVKSLDDFFKTIPIFSGATIMGDGSVSLIFDILKLAERVGIMEQDKDSAVQSKELQSSLDQQGQILLFSLQPNIVYGVKMDSIERLEKIKKSQIDYMGEKLFLRYREGILPLICCWTALDHPKEYNDELNIIVFTHLHKEFGLLVNNIEDVVQMDNKIITDLSTNPVYLGSCIIQHKVITLLNLIHLSQTLHNKQAHKLERLLVWEESSSLKDKVKYLREKGYQVTEVHNREEADEVLNSKENHVDVIVTDTDISDSDSEYLSDQVKKKLGQDIPLVAIHDNEDPSYQEHLDQQQLSEALGEILNSKLSASS